LNYSTIATTLAAIAVFAKAPIPRQFKTRLAVTVGADKTAQLQENMVSVPVQRLLLAAKRLASDIELHTDTCSDAQKTHAVTRRIQAPGDLSVRMLTTGGDVPTVPTAYLEACRRSRLSATHGPMWFDIDEPCGLERI
jgi:glycosyltransferase A (GT-A) superfamily protein (DUF2064 family)